MSDPAPARAAFAARRSHSKVTDDAPDAAELAELVAAMNSVADHSGLRPWRLIELRGDARLLLGDAMGDAAGGKHEKYRAKATRAPLVLAVVVAPRPSKKVPVWEQEVVASGVAHGLGLLLHEAGWGTFWRTGELTRTPEVHAAHGLSAEEYLLGWLYIGGIPHRGGTAKAPKPRKALELSRHLSAL
ncbi:nitroreductase family protein [Leucobacter chromiireducens]|uniref:nitroreductase family protein n=1 Tax=Leucobacter chromiireducens TaxID=283877 RepID=UPI000F6410B0|nr:nitroreductase family protein [Leucobacter chromiireducens]